MLRLAMLKTILRMKKKNRNNNRSSSCRPQQSPITGCNKCLIPTWGLPQGRNTNIHPFVSPAKGGPLNYFEPSGSKSTEQLDIVIFMWGYIE